MAALKLHSGRAIQRRAWETPSSTQLTGLKRQKPTWLELPFPTDRWANEGPVYPVAGSWRGTSGILVVVFMLRRNRPRLVAPRSERGCPRPKARNDFFFSSCQPDNPSNPAVINRSC